MMKSTISDKSQLNFSQSGKAFMPTYIILRNTTHTAASREEDIAEHDDAVNILFEHIIVL